MPVPPRGHRKPAQMFAPYRLVGTEHMTQLVILPNSLLLVSIYPEHVEFAIFSYFKQTLIQEGGNLELGPSASKIKLKH